MGRGPTFSQEQRNFVYVLALATGMSFPRLEPVVRGLAQAKALTWLGPNANEDFLTWSGKTGWRWAKEHEWDLSGVEAETTQPLPQEEQIDDDLLRKRLKIVQHFYDRLVQENGDAYKNAAQFARATEQVEQQITRRMTRPLTPWTLAEICARVIQRLGGDLSQEEAYEGILAEMQRFKLVPAEEGA